jgi:hypothetical protein
MGEETLQEEFSRGAYAAEHGVAKAQLAIIGPPVLSFGGPGNNPEGCLAQSTECVTSLIERALLLACVASSLART